MEEEEEDTPYVKFADRPEFKDVEPVPQNDGPFPVCPISYTPEFSDAMNYFRAMLKTDEKSERALLVTEEVIKLNPANYTAWYFRRLVLKALNADYNKELDFVTTMALKNPKNYQIWHHRQTVVEELNDPSKELAFTAEILTDDAKNYHAWSHRQWVIRKWGLWEKELDYIDQLLQQDIRNNSAWNQRYFVISNVHNTPEKITEEMNYAITKISRAPNNESSWNYLLGLAKGHKLSDFPLIENFCEEKKSLWVVCPHLLSTLLDIYEEKNDKLNAIELCEKLASIDSMHQKYWNWRKSAILQKD